MADGGDAADEILQRTPGQTNVARHAAVLAHGRFIGFVDIVRPRGRIGVWRASEQRKKIEREMIVRVDQAGKNHVSGKIEAAGSAAKRGDPVLGDRDIEPDCFVRAKRDTRSGENHRRQRRIQTAGVVHN